MVNICILLCVCHPLQAQDDLMKILEESEEQTTEKVTSAFKSTRVIMNHSIEMIAKGNLDFRILHRFGPINEGVYEMFGLDQASMRMGFDYGVTDWLSTGIGRSTLNKELDGFVKIKMFSQTRGKKNFPVSILYTSGITCTMLKWEFPERKNYFSSRLAYYHQLIVGRKFNSRFSMQIAPTVVHRNIVDSLVNEHDVFTIGTGARIRLSRSIALNIDYHYVINRSPFDTQFISPLSIGFDIETGGHVFQLHFSNSRGMNERAFITGTKGKWEKGQIQFGFNLSRMFVVHSKKI